MQIDRGMLGVLPYAAIGAGPPVVVLAGVSPKTGAGRDGAVRTALSPLASLAPTRRLILLNRRPRLPTGMTIRQLALEHADALRSTSTGPVDVLGVSTGGSIAQQLAADHPEVVRRLVLVSSACRLGPDGKQLQRRVAELIRAGARRQAFGLIASALVPPRRGQRLARLGGYVLGPLAAGDDQDLADLATTLEMEDSFDLAACANPIRALTLILAGGRDRFYPPALADETARLIPNAQLRILPRRGHLTVMTDRRCRATLAGFLQAR